MTDVKALSDEMTEIFKTLENEINKILRSKEDWKIQFAQKHMKKVINLKTAEAV